jgi:hypothetical protein
MLTAPKIAVRLRKFFSGAILPFFFLKNGTRAGRQQLRQEFENKGVHVMFIGMPPPCQSIFMILIL